MATSACTLSDISSVFDAGKRRFFIRIHVDPVLIARGVKQQAKNDKYYFSLPPCFYITPLPMIKYRMWTMQTKIVKNALIPQVNSLIVTKLVWLQTLENIQIRK